MRKRYKLCLIAVLLIVLSGCNTSDTDITEIKTTEATVPTLDSMEYWDIVQDEIIAMLNSHGLYVSQIASGYPCVQFYVEPGVQTGDDKIVANGLSQEEYEKLYNQIKDELHIILDQYQLAKPQTAFHACNSNIDIFFNNWFASGPNRPNMVTSLKVASYGLDLLEYYHNREDNSYVSREGFFTSSWEKYEVYIP